tara:strand:- start:2391 stop:2741 length:351 start_codon:yes stop_codon:yes gene_type:complete
MSLKEKLGFNTNYSYSTMRNNGLDQRVMFNDVECIWGLRTKGYAPTLIYPRPRIILQAKNGTSGVWIANEKLSEFVYYNESFDFVMHRCIEKESAEDIIEAMFDKNKIFIYNENTK